MGYNAPANGVLKHHHDAGPRMCAGEREPRGISRARLPNSRNMETWCGNAGASQKLLAGRATHSLRQIR